MYGTRGAGEWESVWDTWYREVHTCLNQFSSYIHAVMGSVSTCKSVRGVCSGYITNMGRG